MKVPNDFAEVMLGVISIFVLMTFTVVNLWYLFNTQDSWDFTGNRIDDWVFEQGGDGDNFGIRALKSGTQMFGVSESFSDTIGLAVGGAKDINSFRENIANDFLPIPTDMTYEGLFYDYYFDTGQQEKCKELFCPSYSYAVSPDPLSDEDQYYLSVGLNSGIKEADFSRKKLNLVVVLDISGSMSSPFNKYYYDQFGNRQELDIEDEEDFEKSKMEVANEAVVSLLDHLNGDDRFGIVLFESDAHIAKPLT